MKSHLTIVGAALMIIGLSSFTSFETVPVKTITIAGMIVDAGTLQPLASVEIDDAKGQKFGATDKNGYYKILFQYRGTGDVKLGFKIKKAGYKQYSRIEHWSSLPDGAVAVFYFGLQKGNSVVKPFSVFGKNTMDRKTLIYTSVLTKFAAVREQITFANNIEAAKHGNENVVVQVNGKFYLVNNNGWIALNSGTDMVSMNNKKLVPANQLNKLVKRKTVKSMSTVAANDHKVTIFTENTFIGAR